MIGAEAKIAEGYHAYKSGDLKKALEILRPIAHKRARDLVEQIHAQRRAAEADGWA
jgi:hypothetical protein